MHHRGNQVGSFGPVIRVTFGRAACWIGSRWGGAPGFGCSDTAVPELLYPETAMPSGVFLKKTPPFTVAKRAREFWNRSK
jgi:hypothetical protein